jgi:hypothetical protein
MLARAFVFCFWKTALIHLVDDSSWKPGTKSYLHVLVYVYVFARQRAHACVFNGLFSVLLFQQLYPLPSAAILSETFALVFPNLSHSLGTDTHHPWGITSNTFPENSQSFYSSGVIETSSSRRFYQSWLSASNPQRWSWKLPPRWINMIQSVTIVERKDECNNEETDVADIKTRQV